MTGGDDNASSNYAQSCHGFHKFSIKNDGLLLGSFVDVIKIAPSKPADIVHLSSHRRFGTGNLSLARLPTIAWRIGQIVAALVGKAVKLATGHALVVRAAGIAFSI